MQSTAPSTTLPSRNRRAARTVALAVEDGLLPGVDAAREIMEALGLIEPDGRDVLPDPHDLLLTPQADDFLPMGNVDPSKADLREPPMDRSTLPPGLRNLSARHAPTAREKCGSPAGYRAHLAANENACLPCADAERDSASNRRAAKGVRVGEPGRRRSSEIEHGTESGYRKHLRRDVPVCEPCRLAAREISKQRKRKRSGWSGETAGPSPIEHGTNAGYLKERRRGLPVCDLCRRGATRHRAANRAASRQRKRQITTGAQEKKSA